jgi:ABC-type glycerol-3-phosphate transport system permease component
MARAQSAFGERSQRALLRGIVYVVLALGTVVMVLPFLWMLSTSVMTLGEANAGLLLPRAARLSCPHVNLAKTVEGSVTAFRVSDRVREGAQELHTDSYYVEMRPEEGSEQWQFRLVNDDGDPVEIAPVGQAGGAFTAAWQPTRRWIGALGERG